jgi:hypothetical protein
MATIRIPRLVGKTNKAGLTSWYWQPSATLAKKGWQARPLGQGGSLEDPPADVAAAARALNEQVDGAADLTRAELRRVQRPLTLGDGIKRYCEADFPSVRKPGHTVEEATRRVYRSALSKLERWGGDVALTSITPQRVAKLREALMRPIADGPRVGEAMHNTAHATLRTGRSLFTWLEREGLVPKGSNPFTDFGLGAPPPRQQIWWPPAREAVIAAADAAGEPNLALAIDLAFQIGQREADLLKLILTQWQPVPAYKMDPEVWQMLSSVPVPAFGGRPGYVPGDVWGIRLRQGKTKRWVEVPVVGLTRARIEAAIADAKERRMTSLLFDERRSASWCAPNERAGQQRFQDRFAELRGQAIAAAAVAGDLELASELGELQFRDFRRTAVVHQGELGLADHLIAAVTGHSLDETKKILEVYMPRTTGMAARAIALSQARGAEAAKQEKQA